MKQLIYALLGILSLSEVNSQANTRQLEVYIEQARKDWGVPGMSVSITKDDRTVSIRGYGFLETGKGQPVDENTLFAIASNTKAVVSSSLAKLVTSGSISWEDPVSDHLHYFNMYDPYVTQEITIRDLLCHRAGLGTYSGDVIWYKSTLSPGEVVRRIRYVPQAYSFRSGYGYSNLMFITAGEVIHKVTGKPWDTFARESFFDPLGMDRTITSTVDLETFENVATPHKTVDGKNVPIPWTNWDNMGAAGGIISSAADMAKWISLNLNQGILESDTLLDPAELIRLWTPHNNFYMSASSREWITGRNFNGYGLGWGTFDYFGRQVVTHSGGYDGMYSRVVLVPDEKLGFVILTNNMTGISNALMLYIINYFIEEDKTDWSAKYLARQGAGGIPAMVAERRTQLKTGTQPSLDLSRYTGKYYDPMYDTIAVSMENDQLTLDFTIAPDLSARLSHWHFDTWEINWDQTHAWFDFGTVNFVLDNNRQIRELEFDVPNYDIFFHEIKALRVRD